MRNLGVLLDAAWDAYEDGVLLDEESWSFTRRLMGRLMRNLGVLLDDSGGKLELEEESSTRC